MTSQPTPSAARSAIDAAVVETRLVRLDHLRPSLTNPRRSMDERDLADLAVSIQHQGVLSPLCVRPMPGAHEVAGPFEIVFGERRFKAAQMVGLEAVPCQIRHLDDVAVLEIQVVENEQRADVHELDQADAFMRLVKSGKGYDAQKIADQIGRSVKYVYDRIKLLALSSRAQKTFRAGQITAAHAIVLARLAPAEQARALDTPGALFVEERQFWNGEGKKAVSTREFEDWVAANIRLDAKAPDPMLFPELVETLSRAKEQAEKVVLITSDTTVAPDAREGDGKILVASKWRRADGQGGSETCDYAVTGVHVVGPDRGQGYRICSATRKCGVHWPVEARDAEVKKAHDETAAASEPGRAAKGGEDPDAARRVQEAKDELLRKRVKKAEPEILKALAKALRRAPMSKVVADLVREFLPYPAERKACIAYLPLGSTPESFCRFLSFQRLHSIAKSHWAAKDLREPLKALGVDLTRILDDVAPTLENELIGAPGVGKPADAKTAAAGQPKKPKGPLARKAATAKAKPKATVKKKGRR